MLIDIRIKFCEYSLSGFIADTIFVMHKVPMGNNSKNIRGRVTILALCTSSHAD